MKYCKKCGTQLSDDAQFCPKCGTKQEEEINKIASNTTTEQKELYEPKGFTLVAIWVSGVLATLGIIYSYMSGVLSGALWGLFNIDLPWEWILMFLGLAITSYISKAKYSKPSEVWSLIIPYSLVGIIFIIAVR